MLVYQRILSVEYPLLLDGLAARIARHLCSQSCRVSSTSWDCWYWRPLSSQCCWWKYEWKNTKKKCQFSYYCHSFPSCFPSQSPKISQDIPRYPKVCCRFLGFRLPDLHLSECGSLAFGTDAGVPGVMADGGLRQHGTDAWSQVAINGLQGGFFMGYMNH